MEYKPKLILISIILISIGFFANSSGFLGSVTQESQVNEIEFFQVTEGAYSYDNLQDMFDKSYSGVHSDSAQIGSLEIDSTQYGEYSGGDGCFQNPQVTLNGDTVDNYDLNNPVLDFTSWVNKEDSSIEYRTETYSNGVEAVYSLPFYMDSVVYWGTYYGIDNCYGPMNRYKMDVDYSSISHEVNVPDQVETGDKVKVTHTFNNEWKPLETDLSTEVCLGNGFCKTLEKDNVEISDNGVREVTQSFIAEASGETDVKVSGSVGLDISSLTLEGVVVDGDGDGVKEDPADLDSIKIGDIEGEGVTQVDIASEDVEWSIVLDKFVKRVKGFLPRFLQ